MRRLAIVAHWDARGAAAPHFLRLLDQLGAEFDHVVVASPSELTPDSADEISRRAELFRRPNYGHDFGSWRDALERLDWADDYDELLLTNDSYVGFFRPLSQIIDEMSDRPVEMWGLTKTARRGEHIQSYFLYVTGPAAKSQTFRRFWTDAKPAADRMTAILQQEVGISQAMVGAGFTLGAYFEPTLAERMRANARGVHWLNRRQRAFPARYDTLSEDYFHSRRALDARESDQLNTSSAFADSVFDDGRLPVVKFDVLRNDPFWLDSSSLLADLETEFPAMMVGVRDYLAAMSEHYQIRPYENHRFAHLSPLERAIVGYSRRKGRLSMQKNRPPASIRERNELWDA